ncbi:MAG: 4Fe-4S binding protein [Deltaproteobacteria bacterium]|nr:4Fe-4S binding protein [Deltaproteobacteria bacterium]
MGNRIEVDMDRCKGCGLCVSACPADIIELGDDINLKGYHFAVLTDAAACKACAFCGVICPDVAITVFRGLKK